MFRFEDIHSIYWLALIPLMGLIYYLATLKTARSRALFADDVQWERIKNGRSLSRQKWVLIALTFLFSILAAVNPQWGLTREKVKVEKSDIFFAVDISNSMNATDVSPSRLEKAKRFVNQMVEARKGDRIGLILFAGGAYLQMPLTSDYAAAEMFTRSANTEMAGTQGTAIGEAIRLALKSVKEKNQRALILITDGEDHDDDAVEMAKKAASEGWNVFAVGVGTAEGGFVPVMNEGREEFKTDDEGNPVKSQINEELLQNIAELGNGKYYRLEDNTVGISNDLNAHIEKMKKHAVELKSFTEYRSYYQYLLLAAILFLSIEFFLTSQSEKK